MTALNPQQVLVLSQIAQGRSDRQIAAAMWLSPHTVRTHRRLIRQHLQARNSAHAVAIGFRTGILTEAVLATEPARSTRRAVCPTCGRPG